MISPCSNFSHRSPISSPHWDIKKSGGNNDIAPARHSSYMLEEKTCWKRSAFIGDPCHPSMKQATSFSSHISPHSPQAPATDPKTSHSASIPRNDESIAPFGPGSSTGCSPHASSCVIQRPQAPKIIITLCLVFSTQCLKKIVFRTGLGHV